MKKFLSFCALFLAFFIYQPSTEATSACGLSLSIAAVADLDGDGVKEILLTDHETGELIIWLMNGAMQIVDRKTAIMPGLSWRVAGVGDFNGDGIPDILLRNDSTGEVRIWYLREFDIIGQDTVASMSFPWRIAGVADLNSDGRPEVLWTNPITGEVAVLNIDGESLSNNKNIAALPPPWTIIGIDDFNGDGSPEILYTNSVSGETVLANLDGVPIGEDTLAVPSLDWNIDTVVNSDGTSCPGITLLYTAIESYTRPIFSAGLDAQLLCCNLCIRAPPVFSL